MRGEKEVLTGDGRSSGIVVSLVPVGGAGETMRKHTSHTIATAVPYEVASSSPTPSARTAR